jgi:hypothetical protein
MFSGCLGITQRYSLCYRCVMTTKHPAAPIKARLSSFTENNQPRDPRQLAAGYLHLKTFAAVAVYNNYLHSNLPSEKSTRPTWLE